MQARALHASNRLRATGAAGKLSSLSAARAPSPRIAFLARPIPRRLLHPNNICRARLEVSFEDNCPCLSPVLRWDTRPAQRSRVPFCTATSTGLAEALEEDKMGKKGKAAKEGQGGSSGGSGVAYVQVLGLGSDTGDTSPSVLLFFDKRRYLFNVGEGFQRFCVEHKVRLTRVSHIFLTRVCSEAVGGLPGVLLTMKDASPAASLLAAGENIHLFGPPRLQSLVNAMRTFVNVRDCGLEPTEFGSGLEGVGTPEKEAEKVHEDDLVSISAVVLEARRTPPAGGGQVEEVEAGEEPPAKRARGDEGAPEGAGAASGEGAGGGGEQRARLRGGGGGGGVPGPPPSACYICRLPEAKGKFLPAKAVALGVPKGPAFGRLQRGMPVEVAGRTVQPEEVMEPSTPGPTVVIVDCPGTDYIASLVESPAMHAIREGGGKGCLIHLGPREVVADPAYREWMAGHGEGMDHIIAAAGHFEGQKVLASSAALQAKLTYVDPSVFPPPPAEDAPPPPEMPPGAIAGRNLVRYHLRPTARVGVDETEVPEALDAAAVVATLEEENPAVKDAVAALRAADGEVAAAAGGGTTTASGAGVPTSLQGRGGGEIAFLGTGAAIPSKYRNVSGMYVRWYGHGGMMIDTGEGSFGQMCRRYGREGALDALRDLKLLWISHIHADHHVGSMHILALRAALLGPGAPPLVVVGPRPLKRTLEQYSRIEALNHTFIDCAYTVALRPEELQGGAPPALYGPLLASLEAAMSSLGLTRLDSVDVIHCPHAFGLVLEHAGGFSMAYSGDTRPCPKLVEAAKGVDVLVHEATFDDDLKEEAVAKKHSMTVEAIESGRDAGAYRTVLTHFSQRYPKIPVFDDSFTASTCIAFDLMAANFADIPALPRLVPALKELFADEAPPEDDDAEEGAEGGAGAEGEG